MKRVSETDSQIIFEDKAIGCILGAFVADSCGSYVEFEEVISNKRMDKCMTMPGGGTWAKIAPGQVTDDSELATCLINALIQSNLFKKEKGVAAIDTEHIAMGYREWIITGPFDIGNTTRTALGPLA